MDGIELENNLSYNNGNSNLPNYVNGFSTGTNYSFADNLIDNPDFVSSSDFSLQVSSPAIGAGQDVGLTGEGDLSDNAYLDPPVIGCYEYGSGPAETTTEAPTTTLLGDVEYLYDETYLFDETNLIYP